MIIRKREQKHCFPETKTGASTVYNSIELKSEQKGVTILRLFRIIQWMSMTIHLQPMERWHRGRFRESSAFQVLAAL